jgi:hypothetical protein
VTKMNDDNHAMMNDESFENLLRSARPAAPSNAEETFFKAGWAAAVQHLQASASEPSAALASAESSQANAANARRFGFGRWPSFSSGLAAGLAAGLMASMIWLRPTSEPSTESMVAAPTSSPTAQPVPGHPTMPRQVVSDLPSRSQERESSSLTSNNVLVWNGVEWLSQWLTTGADQPPIIVEPGRLTSRFVNTQQLNDSLRWTTFSNAASDVSPSQAPSDVIRNRPMQAELIEDLF